MKTFLSIIVTSIFLISAFQVSGQHHHARAHHHRAKHHRPVHRSPHRPAIMIVYHPHWAPEREIHRRWVYFPKHQLYWDNWRNVYFYYNGTTWVSDPGLPSHLRHLKLENEKYKELNEADDDNDEIYLK